PRNLYAAFLSTTDDRIGSLLKKVDEAGLAEDTIIIFQSDHGASEEVRAHNGGGSAGPHRGAKFSLYEGGIRVPAIISWPGKLPQNESRNQVATGCDWYPTLMELCGVPAPAHKIDGKSLVPVLKSKDRPTAHESFNWKSGKAVAIREGKWKLIMTGEKVELYNLPSDLGEANNLVKKDPEVVERLQKKSRDYWESIGQKN
ncbi:MAG: arylsulfatase A-like enzyme, partial [Akkermansiaceae bacterium]